MDNLAYSYGSNNRLVGVSDAAGQHHDWDAFSSSFTYDASGNMKSQSGKFGDIAYEHQNLPIHFYLDNNTELIANYNAEGQRILKESSGGAWSFYVTDGMQTLAVITEEGLSHMNLVGGGTFGRIVANSSGAITTSNTRYYHITDHLGSTREVVNNSGSWVETFDYYPFGLLMPKRNTASAETREKFTGHERDDEVGLDYMVWRRYDPTLGRFLGVDPLVDEFPDWSPYAYALNNPLIYIDPDGRLSTHVDSTGHVIAVYDDEDLGVYVHRDVSTKQELDKKRNDTETTSGDGEKIGETEHIDEFKSGDFLDLNYGPIDDWVAIQQYKYVIRLAEMNPILVALLSEGGMTLDIKTRLPGGFRRGYQYAGYWMTAQSAGNRLAGKNAALLNMPWSLTIASSGTLHIYSNRSFGSIRYFGETNYAGRQIRSGYLSIQR